ncbi:hypothetical protein AB0M34_31805 [Nocardia sp. NPDC050193]
MRTATFRPRAVARSHHEGAVQPAGTELAEGADPGAKAPAQQIIDARPAEVEQV